MAFFTPRKKNRVSVDDPTRMQRETGERDGTKKKRRKKFAYVTGDCGRENNVGSGMTNADEELCMRRDR